jgi:hypothetical protein
MKKEYLLNRGEETHTKKSVRVPKVEESYYLCHHILSDDFKKRLSRRDMDERFHLSTAQDKVRKNPQKHHEVSRDRKVWLCSRTSLVTLSMGLHLCCLKFLVLLQVWLCLRTSKSSSLGDVLALIKHRFYAPTCRVNV